MPELNFDKGKIAIAAAGLFCLIAVYGAVVDFQLPISAGSSGPAETVIELEPVDIEELSATHLFGTPPAPPAQDSGTDEQQTPENPPPRIVTRQPVSISITVTGVLASVDQNYSAAIMKVDGTPERLYRVGEDLGKADVILRSVKDETVVIDNNGNEQTYTLKRPGLESGSNGVTQGFSSTARIQQELDGLPPLPPELDLSGNGENPETSGAFTPQIPEVDLDDLPPPLDEMEIELLEQELAREFESGLDGSEEELDDHGYIDEGYDDHDTYEEPIPGPDDEPNFQMPVF